MDATMRELMALLVSEYRAFDKEPPNRDLVPAMQRFEAISLVMRKSGSWRDQGVEFVIQPSMKCIASNSSLSALERLYSEVLDEDDEAFDAVVGEGGSN